MMKKEAVSELREVIPSCLRAVQANLILIAVLCVSVTYPSAQTEEPHFR